MEKGRPRDSQVPWPAVTWIRTSDPAERSSLTQNHGLCLEEGMREETEAQEGGAGAAPAAQAVRSRAASLPRRGDGGAGRQS